MTFKPMLLAGTAIMLAQSQAAMAQTPPPAAEAEGEIVVTGIRASLQAAADIKREANQIVDVITAEDVGKLPKLVVAQVS